MIIKELQIYHFGKFHHETIHLEPGMNIIYGGNEAGKSTIHRFIRAMLFGLPRQRGKAAANDAYHRLRPWDDQGYEGLMILEDRGKTYRIYRNFRREEETFAVYDDATGAQIRLKTGSLEELIPGLNESNYKNTISIAQKDDRFDDKFAASLQSYVANMSTGGDSSVDIEKALRFLSDEERKIKAKMPVKELEQAKLLLEKEASDQTKKSALKDQIYNLRMKIQELDRSILEQKEALRSEKETDRKERMEGIRLLEEKQVLLEQVKRIEDAAARRKDVGLLKQKNFIWFLVCTVIAILLMGLQFVLHIHNLPLQILTGMILVLALVMFAKTSFRKTEDVVDVEDYLKEGKQLKQKLIYYTKKYGSEMDGPGQISYIEDRLSQLNQAKLKYQDQQKRLEWELEKQEEVHTESEKLRQNYEQLRGEMKYWRKELEAVELAKMVIKEVSGEIHRQFGSRLNKEVAEIFTKISGHEIRGLLVDEKLNVLLDGTKQQIPLDRLSQGAVDQIYFALRFCAGELIFEDTEVPVIMDECFSCYDDQRLQKCLSWLMEQNRPQMILFTCHRREMEIMEKMHYPYHVKKI